MLVKEPIGLSSRGEKVFPAVPHAGITIKRAVRKAEGPRPRWLHCYVGNTQVEGAARRSRMNTSRSCRPTAAQCRPICEKKQGVCPIRWPLTTETRAFVMISKRTASWGRPLRRRLVGLAQGQLMSCADFPISVIARVEGDISQRGALSKER